MAISSRFATPWFEWLIDAPLGSRLREHLVTDGLPKRALRSPPKGFHDGREIILEAATGRPLREAQIPGGAVTAVAERAPGEWFASAGSALHLV